MGNALGQRLSPSQPGKIALGLGGERGKIEPGSAVIIVGGPVQGHQGLVLQPLLANGGKGPHGLVHADTRQAVGGGIALGGLNALQRPVGHAPVADQALPDQLVHPGHNFPHGHLGIVPVQQVQVYGFQTQVIPALGQVPADLSRPHPALLHAVQGRMGALGHHHHLPGHAPALEPAADHLFAAGLFPGYPVVVHVGRVHQIAPRLGEDIQLAKAKVLPVGGAKQGRAHRHRRYPVPGSRQLPVDHAFSPLFLRIFFIIWV